MTVTKYILHICIYSGPFTIITVLFLYKILVKDDPITDIQLISYILLMIHYIKRLFESFFVHRSANEEMSPILLIFGILYYWCFGAGFLEYEILFTDHVNPNYSNSVIPYILSAMMLASEYMNLRCHLVLRDLRPPGTKKRGIPYGYGFDWVTSANFMWEFFTWVIFACLIRTIFSVVFCTIGFVTMSAKAVKNHKRNVEYFDGKKQEKYPTNRKAIIPFLL